MTALRDGLRWATDGAWVQDLPQAFQWLGLTQRAFPFVAAAVTAMLTAAFAWGCATSPPAARLCDRLEPGRGAARRPRTRRP